MIILFLVAAVRRRRHKFRLSPIPEHLLVNERCNVLSNDTTGCANAVQAQYARERMRSPLLRGMKAIAWDDGMCFDGISRVHSAALARAIRHEGNGMYKSDACRLAQLAEHGGYYLDNDVVPHIDVRELGAARVGCASHPSFIAVRQSWEPVQFLNAFVAATPRHPIIMRALNLTARFYNVDTPPERGGLDGGLRGARRGGSYLGDRDAAGPLKRRLHGRRLFWMGPLTLRVAYGASRAPPPHTHTPTHLLQSSCLTEWWVGRSMGNLPYTDPGSTACDALLLWEHRPRQRMLDCAQGPLAAVLCHATRPRTWWRSTAVQQCVEGERCPRSIMSSRCQGC